VNSNIAGVKPPSEAPQEQLLFSLVVNEGKEVPREYIFCALNPDEKMKWMKLLELNLANLVNESLQLHLSKASRVKESPQLPSPPRKEMVKSKTRPTPPPPPAYRRPPPIQHAEEEEEEEEVLIEADIHIGCVVIIINDFKPSDYTRELGVWVDELYEVINIPEDGWLLLQKQNSDVCGMVPYDCCEFFE
jgi:hypothetical protein